MFWHERLKKIFLNFISAMEIRESATEGGKNENVLLWWLMVSHEAWSAAESIACNKQWLENGIASNTF